MCTRVRALAAEDAHEAGQGAPPRAGEEGGLVDRRPKLKEGEDVLLGATGGRGRAGSAGRRNAGTGG
jgi:hypothetical protein